MNDYYAGGSPIDINIPHDDIAYTGESSSMDYFRNKARDFQIMLNNLDLISNSLWEVRYEINGNAQALTEWSELWETLQAKKSQFKYVAQAVNVASSGLNSINVRFPQLSIPQSLGVAPVIAITAAIAGAATLIYWGSEFIPRVFSFLDYLISLQFADESTRQKIIELKEKTNADINKNSGGTFGQLAIITKYVAVAGAAYLIYQLFRDYQNGKRK